jgi:hypothetical protein
VNANATRFPTSLETWWSRSRKTSRTKGKRVVALAKMKNYVGGVRIVWSWVRERERRQSNVWTMKKERY